MPRLIIHLFLVFLFPLSAGAESSSPSDTDDPLFFELYVACEPISVGVVLQVEKKMNLEADTIRNVVESRLRSARIYDEPSPAFIILGVQNVGWAFHIMMEFVKRVHDVRYSDQLWGATTWTGTRLGLAGQEADRRRLILAGVAELMDEFLIDYFRANTEEACQHHTSQPSAQPLVSPEQRQIPGYKWIDRRETLSPSKQPDPIQCSFCAR